MLRVILVIDDYNELIYLQTLLKKIGFDVEGLQNQKKYADLSLGFNPQILVTSFKGAKVNGLTLAEGIRKVRGLPKIIALKGAEDSAELELLEKVGIDLMLDSPVNPKQLLLAISTLAGIDENALIEKYDKIKSQVGGGVEDRRVLSFDENGQPVEEIENIKSAIAELTGEKSESESANFTEAEPPAESKVDIAPPSYTLPEKDPKRRERFDKWIKDMGALEPQSYDRNRIREFNKKIRAWPQPPDIEQIEDERKQFVKALFKK